MKKRNITITTLAAFLVLAMAAWSFAGPGYGRGGGRGCGGPGYGANNAYSQLTPEKQAAVESIFKKYDGQFTELRNKMLTKHSMLQAMVNGGDANEKKIGQLTADIGNLQTQMLDLRESMGKDIEKETGIAAAAGYASCPRYGQTSFSGGRGRGGRGLGNGVF